MRAVDQLIAVGRRTAPQYCFGCVEQEIISDAQSAVESLLSGKCNGFKDCRAWWGKNRREMLK